MKKAAVASLLAVSALIFPGTIARFNTAMAQAAPASSGVQMDPDEFAMYDTAANKTPDPKAQAAALEAYLAKYPNSQVKNDVLQRIMGAYANFDHAKAIDAADKVLQSNPNNLQAYIIEVAFRTEAANALTDPAAKQAGLDSAADFAQRGLKLAQGPKPDGVADADWAKLKSYATGLFYPNIGTDLLAKKDSAGAIAIYKQELSGMDPNSLPALQETYFLGNAYYISTPPDYLSCAFYTTRTASLAPDQYKAQFQTLATYCYKKYHGSAEGYDALVTLAKANPNPPADLATTVKPAPTDADQVNTLMSSTADADLPKLALSDKEYVIKYGTTAQADKVFDTIKGKSFEIPDAVVISATADQLQAAVSDDAVQSKTADFTVAMKTPFKTVPVAGAKVTFTGVYASYTQNPLILTMTDGEEVVKAAPKKATTPVRKKPHH